MNTCFGFPKIFDVHSTQIVKLEIFLKMMFLRMKDLLRKYFSFHLTYCPMTLIRRILDFALVPLWNVVKLHLRSSLMWNCEKKRMIVQNSPIPLKIMKYNFENQVKNGQMTWYQTKNRKFLSTNLLLKFELNGRM